MPTRAPRPRASSLFAGAHALPYDPAAAVRHLRDADPRLAAIIDRIGAPGLSLDRSRSVFGCLCQSIVFQQLAGAAARAIMGRVDALASSKRRGLTPEDVLSLSDEALRGAGLSRGKLLALRDLAAHTLDGTVPTWARLERLGDEEIVERLTQVRGVGRWTVEMLLIFRLGRPDVLPVDDYGVRKGFQHGFGKRALPTAKQLRAYGERWAPYRSVVAWYLWRAAEGAPRVRKPNQARKAGSKRKRVRRPASPR